MHTAPMLTLLSCAAIVACGCHGGELRGVYESKQQCSSAECSGRSGSTQQPSGAAGVRPQAPRTSPGSSPAGSSAAAGRSGSGGRAGGTAGTSGASGGSAGSAHKSPPPQDEDADAGMPAADGGGVPSPGPHVFYVAPRVVYAGEPRDVRLLGTGLRAELGVEVLVDGTSVGMLEVVSAVEGRIRLPGVPAGKHRLELGAQAPPSPALEFVSIERPSYPDSELRLPEYLEPRVFDSERRAFFANAPNVGAKLYRVAFDGTQWAVREAQIPAAHGITQLPATGELLLTSGSCTVATMDPDTLTIKETSAPSTGCTNNDADNYTHAYALADGDALLANMYQAVRYPGFFPFDAPRGMHTAVLSPDRTRMLWAAGAVYSYDFATRAFEMLRLLGTEGVLDLSEDGRRLVHGVSVYDRAGRFLGTLAGVQPGALVAISGRGEVAVASVAAAGLPAGFQAHDVRGESGPFPAIGSTISVPYEPYGFPYRLFVDDAGQTIFVFLRISLSADEWVYRMLVRRLPTR